MLNTRVQKAVARKNFPDSSQNHDFDAFGRLQAALCQPTWQRGEHENGNILVTSRAQKRTWAEGEHDLWPHFGHFASVYL